MLSQKVIQVCDEFGNEPIELPLEPDSTLLFSTLNSAFPDATGIKFRNPDNNCLRAVRFENNRFYSPNFNSNDGWGDNENIQYFCVFPHKTVVESKPADESTATVAQEKPHKSSSSSGAQPKTVDLIVLNLSASTSESELKEYFESKFGPLLMVELKRDRKTGSSRRFAFIRFKNYKEQMRALSQAKHKIDGHQARLALPDFRDPSELYQENKCFIGRVNEAIKASDLREYFSQFGDIVEISYPKKFKGYAFITFADADVARKVCGQDFIVKGYSLCVSKSTHGNNKKDGQSQLQNYQQDYSQQDWSNGWFQANSRQDQWPSGQKYVTAPLNPVGNASNFYGNSVLPPNVNPMVNALSIAMSNMMNNPGYNNQYSRGNNWNQQQRMGDNSSNKNKSKNANKQKKAKNATKKATNEELAKRLMKANDQESSDEGGNAEESVHVQETLKQDD